MSTGVPTSTAPLADSDAHVFYRTILDLLTQHHIPFLLGGAFAFRHYTGVVRDTKDLDLFLKREDQDRTMELIEKAGYRVQRTAPHWLTKAFQGDFFVDFIFGTANGIRSVDDSWFDQAPEALIMNRTLRLMRPEEMIWSKSFVMERDRFDGADIYHLLRATGAWLRWERLLALFGPHWRVLLSHLVMYGFVYPSERAQVPGTILEALLERLSAEENRPGKEMRICRGTLFSRTQYAKDLHDEHFLDARLRPHGTLTEDQIVQ